MINIAFMPLYMWEMWDVWAESAISISNMILARLLHPMWFISALSWYCWAIMNVWNVIYHFEDGWWPGYKYSSCWYCCCCNRKIYYQPRPHFNGHWKMPTSFNTNLRSATFLQNCPSSVSSKLQQRWVDFPFPDSSLHLSTPCISWCSEYLGMFRVSAATQGPVIRGNTNTLTHEHAHTYY